jgi:predicted site-specific integrase-resolvase
MGRELEAMSSNGKGFYTTSDLAKMFNVAVGSVKNWSDDGSIPNVTKTPGRHRRYTDEHVKVLAKLLGREPKTPTVTPTTAESHDAT